MVLLVPGEGPLSQVTGHLPNVQLGRIHSGIFCRCIRRLPRRPLRSHDAISERLCVCAPERSHPPFDPEDSRVFFEIGIVDVSWTCFSRSHASAITRIGWVFQPVTPEMLASTSGNRTSIKYFAHGKTRQICW